MNFLQNSPVQIHGNLKSSNVLIDSHWTSKLTDHGLFLFKEGQEVDEEAGTEAKYYGNLWLSESFYVVDLSYCWEYLFVLSWPTMLSWGGWIGVCKTADPCLFFAKSVCLPQVLFKSETTTTSETRSVKIQK